MRFTVFGPPPPYQPPRPPPKPEPQPDAEETAAIDQRLCDFHALGFTDAESFALAWTDVSVSYAREILRHGCSHALALQILL